MKPIIISNPGAGTIRLPGIDCRKATGEIVAGIVEYLRDTDGKGIVIGLSGGVDSALSAVLCKKAADRINGKFYVLIMPSRQNNKRDTKDAEAVAKSLGLKLQSDLTGNDSGYCITGIEDMIEAGRKALPSVFGLVNGKSIPYENLQSRMRMVLLYSLKEATDTRVAGTGNRDEDYGLGYFTKYGDGGVDFSPIANLSKRLVRAMAVFNKVPKKIIDKQPSAGLRSGQTDKDDLGCSYFQAEVIVAAKDQGLREKIVEITGHASKDRKLSVEVRKHLAGISRRMVDRVLFRHEKLAPHKLNMPPVMGITGLS